MKTIPILLTAIFFLFPLSTFVQAENPPEEDYRYQLDQYRRHYSEYQIFKSDYFDNPTLDNEQKTVLTGRAAIVARELAQSSYVRWLGQLLNATDTKELAVTIVRAQLSQLFDFYSQQADLARSIQTKKDMTAFTTAYLSNLSKNKTYWDRAQIIIKMAQLRHLQRDADAAFAAILPQIEDKKSLPLVKDGIQEVYDLQAEINSLLEQTTNLALNLEQKKLMLTTQNRNLTKSTRTFSQVQSLQIRLINRIIDLDENYVER